MQEEHLTIHAEKGKPIRDRGQAEDVGVVALFTFWPISSYRLNPVTSRLKHETSLIPYDMVSWLTEVVYSSV